MTKTAGKVASTPATVSMKFFRRHPPRSTCYRIPEGDRIYAIGDIHGRADCLDRLLGRIDDDHAARGPAKLTLIFLGDLVDRGPDSAAVVARVKALCESGVARCLRGNHEEVFVQAANGEPRGARALIAIGGLPTLLSYGISKEDAEFGSFADLAALLKQRIPADHIEFITRGCEDMISIGDYLFVHAGVRPGIAINAQKLQDLRWIREDFLSSARDHGAMIVHGHTVTDEVEQRANRIGIDTGAFQTGVLSAIGLEGSTRWVIDTRDYAAAIACGKDRLGGE